MVASAGERMLPEAKTRGGEAQVRGRSAQERTGTVYAGTGACTLGMRILQTLLERGLKASHIEKLP
jgi:hypothetical protein